MMKGQSTMEKWEYLVVQLDRHRIATVNGVPHPDFEKGSHYSAFLNQLGEEGWELVTAADGGLMRAANDQLIFMRPKR